MVKLETLPRILQLSDISSVHTGSPVAVEQCNKAENEKHLGVHYRDTLRPLDISLLSDNWMHVHYLVGCLVVDIYCWPPYHHPWFQ